MQRIIVIVIIVSCLLCTSVAIADVINGSFENGLTGWDTSLDYYGRGTDLIHNPLPAEQVVPYTIVPPSSIVSNAGGLEPVDGTDVGKILCVQGPWGFTYANKQYEYYAPTITLSQNIQMSAGDKLTGFMSFGTNEFLSAYTDRSYVSINNQTILSLNIQAALDLNIFSDIISGRQTPWVYWSWTAPATGLYTLSLNVAGDDEINSWAFFDNIEYHSVPEPSTVTLLGFGIVMMVISWRIAQAHRKV